MVASRSFAGFNEFPDAMVSAVATDAARDADRVRMFLSALGILPSPEKPLSLPARFLLHLGAGLRLLSWEANGFFAHREVGLPEARAVIRDAFQSLNNSGVDPAELCIRVMGLSIERFAWTAPAELGTDVSLAEADEDALQEALADFLWAHRPRS
jgi:hypothetical protein